MYGKRATGFGDRGKPVESKQQCTQYLTIKQNPSVYNLSSIIVQQDDNRPYVEVQIAGEKLLCLLDSGAQINVAGKDFSDIIKRLQLKAKPNDSLVKTADGSIHNINGEFEIPIRYNSRTQMLKVLYVKQLPQSLILGMNFWNAFKIKPVICNVVENVKNTSVSEAHDLEIIDAERLQEVLKKMPFSKDGELSKTHLISHSINTGNAAPIKQKHYVVSPYMQELINVEIDRLLALGVIVSCEPNAWSLPIVSVRKPSGKIRLCLDARKLNEVTVKDAYPQQQINRILGRLSGTKVLSAIDFSDAFLQVPLTEDSQAKTAFAVSGRGYYKYTRMAFGLCNSGATLCRLVDHVIGCDLEPYVFVYLDDIIVATESFEKHFEILKELAARIKKAGLTISVEKSRFCMKVLKYLGYIVSVEGVRPDPEKIESILNYPIPKSIKDIRRLIGLTGWYRRFIPDYSTLTAPITELLKTNKTKQIKFQWTDDARESLEKIKIRLTSAPILSNPNFQVPFILQTDASDVGLGGVLVQGEGEEEQVVAYWSRKLTSAEKKYQTTERECLAVIQAIEHYRPYIEGTHFTVITDHASLLWLQNLKDPAGRLGRWALRLQAYNFTLIHRKGKFMTVADALSRAVEVIENVSNANRNDVWYDKLKLGIENRPEKFKQFKVENGSIYKYCNATKNGITKELCWRLVVQRENRPNILKQCHDDVLSGHGGYFKTAERIKCRYYWPKMDVDIRKYVRKCETCKACKPSNEIQRSPMGNFRSCNRPWEIIYIDFVGPLPRSRSGFVYMLVIVDGFSKFVHVHPMRTATTKTTINCLKTHIFLVFGTPKIIVSDNGSQFSSREYKTFLEKYKVTTWYTSRYHPQANAAEAANKTIETTIRAYLMDKNNHKDWDVYLPEIACAMNTSKHSSTKFSPYVINFGQEMFTSGLDYSTHTTVREDETVQNSRLIKIREMVQENLRRTYNQNKHKYDLRSRSINYKVGDIVWLKNRVLSNAIKGITDKLSANYRKCTIKKRVGTNSYEVEDMEGKNLGIFNTDCMKT